KRLRQAAAHAAPPDAARSRSGRTLVDESAQRHSQRSADAVEERDFLERPVQQAAWAAFLLWLRKKGTRGPGDQGTRRRWELDRLLSGLCPPGPLVSLSPCPLVPRSPCPPIPHRLRVPEWR